MICLVDKLMKSKKLLQSLLVAFLFIGLHSCAEDPRQGIERKYERKVEKAREDERKAIAENDGSLLAQLRRDDAGLALAQAEQDLACTKQR